MSASTSLLAEGTRQRVEAWLATLRGAGVPYHVNSTRRSRREQQRLFDAWQRGESELPVAPPGSSAHELGHAVDVSFESDEDLLDAADSAADFGLLWAGAGDPVHFEDVETVEPRPSSKKLVDVAEALATRATSGIAGEIVSFLPGVSVAQEAEKVFGRIGKFFGLGC